MLMDDIRSKRYTLRKVMVSQENHWNLSKSREPLEFVKSEMLFSLFSLLFVFFFFLRILKLLFHLDNNVLGVYMASKLCTVQWGREHETDTRSVLPSMWQAFKILKDVPTYHKLEQITCVGFVIILRVISKVLSCFPLRDCFRLFLLERTFILSYNIGFGIPECKVLPWLDTVMGKEDLQWLKTACITMFENSHSHDLLWIFKE